MIGFPNKKYNVIYADPPWRFDSKAYQDRNRKMLKLEETQYPTMSTEEIKNLPVQDIADKDCALFLWVTDSHLKDGIEVMKSWGFKYKTIAFVWIKTYESGQMCVNFAPWTLKSWEICLLGIKGSMGKYKQSNKVKGLIVARRTKHSKKPDEVRKSIETLFGDVPKIELFARQTFDGWDCWGNEVS